MSNMPSEQEDIEILEERFAKGEITRKKFNEMKKEVQEDYEAEKWRGKAQAKAPPKRHGIGYWVSVLIVISALAFLYGGNNPPIPLYNTTTTYSASYGCNPLPCTYTRNGNFTFLFTLLNGNVSSWTFPVTTYNYYLTLPRTDPYIKLLDTKNGKTIYTWDYRSTVTPSFFAGVTPQLTQNKTAGQFVAEVQNINRQLVNYSTVFLDTAVYSAQLLGEGQGDCKDKGILIASILEAGNIQMNYNMTIDFVYVDAENLTNPSTVNHLMLYVTYANGTTEFLDTTHVLDTSPYFNGTVDGWYYNLSCTMQSCQATPICTGAYCNAVGYSAGSGTSYDTCSQSGYVTGADGLCHQECGGAYLYCNTGYSCNNYYNECSS